MGLVFIVADSILVYRSRFGNSSKHTEEIERGGREGKVGGGQGGKPLRDQWLDEGPG